MQRPIQLAAALAAICAVALMLSACGGSDDDGTQPTPTSATSTGVSPGPASEAVKGATGSTPEQHAKAGKQPGAASRGGSTAEANPKAMPKPHADTGGDQQAQPRQTRTPPKLVPIKGCPTGMSRSQCGEVGKAYEQQTGEGDSAEVVKANECPRAMSESECEAAGDAYQPAQDGGRIVQPGECPRAMTEQQCIEVGKAYEEAAK